jgi:hypothetical protein
VFSVSAFAPEYLATNSSCFLIASSRASASALPSTAISASSAVRMRRFRSS